MDKQNEFDKIEKFNAGKLKGKELSSFKDKLKNNKGFADEVRLHKDMEQAFNDSSENDFRANLEKLGRRDKTARIQKGIIGLLSIVVIGLFFSWRFTKEEVVNTSNTPDLIEMPKSEMIDTEIKDEAVGNKAIDEKEEQPIKKLKNNQVKPTPTPSENAPIALNLDVNPVLEAHMGNAIRGGQYVFEIIEPVTGSSLAIENNESVFHFSGLLSTKKRSIDDDFQVHLFSNKKGDFENFRPVLTFPLVFEKEEKHFSFNIIHKQKLPKGLYYYLLEDANTGEIIKVGKVFNYG